MFKAMISHHPSLQHNLLLLFSKVFCIHMWVCVVCKQWAVRINYGTFYMLQYNIMLELRVCVTLAFKRFKQFS